MKRRLRKKHHLGEFQELGFRLTFIFHPTVDEAECDRVLDDFIEHAIEANGLYLGGGGDRSWFGFVAAGRGSVTEEGRAAVVAWLEAQPSLATVAVGPLSDAWYSFDDPAEALHRGEGGSEGPAAATDTPRGV